MTWGRFAWAATCFFVCTGGAALVLLGFVPDAAIRAQGNSRPLTAAFLAVLLVFSVVGAVVAQHQPRNPIGWLFVAMAAIEGCSQLAYSYTMYSLEVAALPIASYAAWFATWASVLPPGMISLVFLLFPDGHLVTPRWRYPAWGCVALLATVVAHYGLVPGPLDDFPSVTNPLSSDVFTVLATIPADPLLAPLLACAAAALVVRLRRARGVGRQQVKWFAYSAAMIPVFLVAGGVVGTVAGTPDDGTAEYVSGFAFAVVLAGLPVSAGIAILRHRLYDIDVVIKRTLVYGVLTAALVMTYLGSVLLFRVLVDPWAGASDLAVAASTLAVAALFRPLRGRIQDAVDRRFYRSRYDASRTVATFADRLKQEVALDSVSADLRSVVDDTLRPTQVS